MGRERWHAPDPAVQLPEVSPTATALLSRVTRSGGDQTADNVRSEDAIGEALQRAKASRFRSAVHEMEVARAGAHLRGEGEWQYGVRTAGKVIEAFATWSGSTDSFGGGRGSIRCFSSASRRRLFRAMAAVDWSKLGPALFVTLTYPGEFPLSGREVKAHHAALMRRWVRRWGRTEGAWKLEFQRRGAPHLHLWQTSNVPPVVMRRWLAKNWFEIVGSGDKRHLRAGVQVDQAKDNPAAYFAGYVGKSKGSKEYQNTVPKGFEDVGRFWGMSDGCRPQWVEHRVSSSAEWVGFRRQLVRYRRSCSRRRVTSPEWRWQFWTVCRTDAAEFARRIAEDQGVRFLPPDPP